MGRIHRTSPVYRALLGARPRGLTMMLRTMPAIAMASAIVMLTPTIALGQQGRDQVRVGTVIIAHGADSLWNAQVADVARQVRTGGPVEVSYLMGAGASKARF